MKRLSQLASVAALVVGSNVALLTGAQAATVDTASLPGDNSSSTPGASSSTTARANVIMNFDENGNISCIGVTCTASVGPDPTGLVSGNVLIYTRSTNFSHTTTLGILDQSGQLSDAITWLNNPGRMIFYSFNDFGSLADVGSVPAGFSPPIADGGIERPDGSFTLVSFEGSTIYNGMSDIAPLAPIPLPPAIYLFGGVLGGAF